MLRAEAAGLRCLPDVRGRSRGRGASADQLLPGRGGGHEGPDADRARAPAAAYESRADLQRPQRLLPAALPEQVPQPHRHSRLPQGERRGQLARVGADLQADDPLPVDPRSRLPRPLRGTLPPRRGGRGDRDPGHPPLRGRPGPQGDARRRDRPADPLRGQAEDRAPGGRDRLGPGRDVGGVLPPDRRSRRRRLRARPRAWWNAALRDPAVSAAQGRGPRGGVRVDHEAWRALHLQPGARGPLLPRRPAAAGLRRGRPRDRLLRHQQARDPERERRRGVRRARVPAHRDPRAALPGPQGLAGRRHRRRVHLDGLHPHVDPPGRRRGHARVPPRHEGHAGCERGPRGNRGGRDRDLPGRPCSNRYAQEDRQGNRGRVRPDEARRAGRLRSAATGTRAGHRVHDSLRPRAARHRAGTRSLVDQARVGRSGGDKAAPVEGRCGHVRDRPRGCVRDRGRAGRIRHRGPGQRGGPARRLRGGCLPARARPGRDQDPPDTRRAAARVPVDRALHERGKGAPLPPELDGRGDPQQELRRVRDPVQPAGGNVRIAALSAVHLRSDRVLRPPPPGHRIRHHAQDARAAVPAGGRVPERHREPLHRHEPRLHPRRFPRVHPSRAVALHRLRAVRAGLRGGRGRRVLRLHAHRLRHAGHDTARHEPQRHAVCVLRAVCRDVPDRRPDAEAPRPPEVRRRRESLHPVRNLRGCLPVRRPARRRGVRAFTRSPRRADDRSAGDRGDRPRNRDDLRPARARLGGARADGGPAVRPRAPASGAPAVGGGSATSRRRRPPPRAHCGYG